MNIHCSACATQLPTGSLFCPGCGLPLTAHAVPTAAPPNKAFPIIACLLGGFVILIILLAAGKQHKQSTLSAEPHAAGASQADLGVSANAAALETDIHSGKLDAYAFQKLCGQPEMRVNHKDFFSLFYPDKNLVVMFRHRTPGSNKAEAARAYPYALFDEAFFWQITPRHIVTTESAIAALHCGGAR